ncbi:MAG TPA: bifunctional nuclease domain-containing protein [Candidatus Acidoferrales bacterium]|nr:bifunctional nuclease domain-containing protein [Candidatus Acidoferrales bacterium]
MKPYIWVFALHIAAFPALVVGQESPVEMRVRQVLLDPSSNAPVVILESVQDKRFLPIWIGPAEASSIAQELEQVASPRPNTHDLIRNILKGLNATLHKVTINDLRNNTYYATITLRMRNQEFQIDSRPSDAIAVALRMKAAIFATPQVLAKARPLPAAPGSREDLKESMGIHLQDLTPELASLLDTPGTEGVLVADVELGSPAMQAGVSRGDVILKIDEKPVQKAAQVESALRNAKRPARVKLEILRKGKPLALMLELRP